MIAKAEAKYIRISPFKVRPVIGLIKGADTQKASFLLAALKQKAAFYLGKVLKSAVSNAKNKGYAEEKLFISKVIANPGPVLKRYRAASFGRAASIKKRMTHILIELGSNEKIIEKAVTK